MTTTMKQNLKDAFKKGDAGKSELFEIARQFAEDLVTNGVNHHQLRNLLDYVIWAKQSHRDGDKTKLSPETFGRVATLRPRLAYMAARMPRLMKLQKEMNELLRHCDCIDTGADLARLYDFTAALDAFHKYYDAEKEMKKQELRRGARR